MNKDKIRAMFMGIAIGDALGKCVETWDDKRIAEVYGRITEYHVPDGHKWFNGHKAGTITDDTQLTLAVAEGIIECRDELLNKLVKPVDLITKLMEAQANQHVLAFKETTDGWGRTTREACRSLANGSHWSSSGMGGNGTGNGNGVAMKIAPAAVLLNVFPQAAYPSNFLVYLNDLTHTTTLSLATSLVHAKIVARCLDQSIENKDFFSDITNFCTNLEVLGKVRYEIPKLEVVPTPEEPPRLSTRLRTVFERYHTMTDEEIIAEFGGGSCYCYDSLPFTWTFFFRNPYSIDSLYDVISAGGDTDSNGSMLGGLLGAYNGMEIFPEHLIEGLLDKDKVLDTAERFADALNIID